MNKEKVVKELEERYPRKTIIRLPEDNPTEILCETEPTQDHPEYSVAISVIDKSAKHVHHKTTEAYKVLKGSLTVHKNNETHELHEGDTLTVNPGEEHWAEGNKTWIECRAEPGWIAIA